MAKLLNDDVELQAKAKALGCKGVAVSIHTNGITSAEQERRFKDYLAGEYMAVVGDEKFKEGFDYPPMKTIFDSAHSSMVDKAQILGRALRKWWNEKKQRFEGATIIDTVTYIGSENKEEDEKLRMQVLKKAISVKAILEAAHVDGPEAPKPYGLHLVTDKKPLPKNISKTVIVKRLSEDDFQIRIFGCTGEAEIFNKFEPALVEKLQNVFDDPKLVKNYSYQSNLVEEIRISVGQLLPKPERPIGPPLFDDDPNAEYIVDLQHLYHLEEEIDNFQKIKLSDIKEAIEIFHFNNNGKVPSGKSPGLIEHPAVTKKIQWPSVVAWFARGGSKGLSDDPEWRKWEEELKKEGREPSWPEFLDKCGYKKFIHSTSGASKITMEDIKMAVDKHIKDYNRKLPTVRSGDMQRGPLKGWNWGGRIRDAIIKGNDGLFEDPEWKKWTKELKEKNIVPSLAEFLIKYGYKKRAVAQKERMPLTMTRIRSAVENYRSTHQKKPSGRLKESIDETGAYTWVGVNAALMSGNNDLTEDPEWKKWSEKLIEQNIRPSLSILMRDMDTSPNAWKAVPVSASEPSGP